MWPTVRTPSLPDRWRSAACLAALLVAAPGCCWLGGYSTPPGITVWQDPGPPRLRLHERAARYQRWAEERHQSPEGIAIYSRKVDSRTGELIRPQLGTYGNLADGPFHTGLYLASQAVRYAVTRDPAAREQVLRALDGLSFLMQVTGEPGLLSRYVSMAGDVPGLVERSRGDDGLPAPSIKVLIGDDSWVLSSSLPGLAWRADVSKDQYAGLIHGLGMVLLHVDDPEARRRVAALSGAVADRLVAHHLQIIDIDGRPTTHNDLADRVACVPIGVNALIALAIARVAASSTSGPAHGAFRERLLRDGYPRSAYWAHFSVFGVGNRVNDNMAYLALYPLFLLEDDEEALADLWDGEERTWGAVQDDRNAFFAFAHAGMARKARDLGLPADDGSDAGARGRAALLEFPDDKVAWPVDLTREGFRFERAFLNSRKCEPRAREAVPLHLRPRGSCFWVSDPRRLVGNLTRRGDEDHIGSDFLLAYWLGRHLGLISAED